MFYQWGHKDPYTFATNSELWGNKTNEQYGKYPVKIYTVDGVLIYQEYNGGSNKDKQPAGGLVVSSTMATSMMETIKNPITFYGGIGSLINQVGQTRALWDHYWTSYSRGTDGITNSSRSHNNYLDGYAPQRLKAIYDPCPFGFRIPTNGTYNNFTSLGWFYADYSGGIIWNSDDKSTWFVGHGFRIATFQYNRIWGWFMTSVPATSDKIYLMSFVMNKTFQANRMDYSRSYSFSVRCIEEI